jgi:monoamine oxidase
METEEHITEVRSGRRVSRLFKALVVLLAIGAGAYWYVKQPRQDQTDIQDKAADVLDRTAVAVGHAVSNVVDHVRETDWSEVQHSASGVATRVKDVDWGGAVSNVGANAGRAGRAIREKVGEHIDGRDDAPPAGE